MRWFIIETVLRVIGVVSIVVGMLLFALGADKRDDSALVAGFIFVAGSPFIFAIAFICKSLREMAANGRRLDESSRLLASASHTLANTLGQAAKPQQGRTMHSDPLPDSPVRTKVDGARPAKITVNRYVDSF